MTELASPIEKAMILGGIRKCETREDIEKTFDHLSIHDKNKRINILVEAMYNPQMFSSGDTDLEQDYILTMALFLTMTWKLTELYNKAGFGTDESI